MKSPLRGESVEIETRRSRRHSDYSCRHPRRPGGSTRHRLLYRMRDSWFQAVATDEYVPPSTARFETGCASQRIRPGTVQLPLFLQADLYSAAGLACRLEPIVARRRPRRQVSAGRAQLVVVEGDTPA